MDEFKPNSHKYKSEQQKEASKKKIEKVIVGTAKQKKKSDVQKLTDVFISEDVSNVKSYILLEVLVPAVKKAISDIVTNGIDMILYGETGRTKRSSPGTKVSYRDYYDRQKDRHDHGPRRTKVGYHYDDVVLESRGEAEEVLLRMDELISRYGMVCVADLYDMVDLPGSWTDNDYGWTDIRSASVVRIKDGYVLKLPKALPLN